MALGTQAGRIECETVVNATGMWGAQTAAMAGSDLAVSPVEHQYVVTERIAGLPPDLPTLRDQHHAVRLAAGLIDMSLFSKFEIAGPGALPLLQRLAGADLDVRTGKIVYTQLLNERGGIEADVTVTRLGPAEFYLVTGAGFGRHDVAFVRRHAPDDGSVTVRDVTSAFGVLTLAGPSARQIARRISSADLANAAFGYMTARWIDLGHAPVLALRAGYVGELGWEFHVPTEYLRDLYDRLHEAGADLGLRDVGCRAVNSLRLEKQYVAWAADIRSDDDPYAAGLGFAVRPDKPDLLAGPALRKIRDDGPAERLCWFAAGPEVIMHGGELLTHPDHGFAASVRSAGFGYTAGQTIFSAYLPAPVAAVTAEAVDTEAVDAERRPARLPHPLLTAPGPTPAAPGPVSPAWSVPSRTLVHVSVT